jgi:NAD(P)-dependent dehydrogenase (short-subunit alcohol dehydrogenase family)
LNSALFGPTTLLVRATSSRNNEPMQLDFADRVALVTGAGSGIGRASALEFARHKARVIIADIDKKGAEETARLILEAKGQAIVVEMDVSNSKDVQRMVDRSIEEYGRLDFAHNNAGTEGRVDSSRGTLGTTEEEWDRLMAINLKGVWMCMRAEIPHMLEGGGGSIVNSGSISSLVGSTAGFVAYSASKSGILGLTRSAALEFASRGIRINAVCPGYIETPLWQKYIDEDPDLRDTLSKRQPIGRLGTAEEVARAVAWLCSDASSLITGVALPLDGGFTAQ